jgi:precorrin-3B synthase
VRLRLPGGRIAAEQLRFLVDVAERYGDGLVHLTGRANLQLRALPAAEDGSTLRADVLAAVEATGLLPSRSHDLARNLMASPQTGLAGGLTDLRPTLRALDAVILDRPALGTLPGRFLFVLDDGRGDLLDRSCDLGLVAVAAERVQLRVGEGWGEVIHREEAPDRLASMAEEFLAARGTGPTAPWHVEELAELGLTPQEWEVTPEPAFPLPPPAPALPYGVVPGGHHVAAGDRGLDREAVDRLAQAAPILIITPWRGVLIPEESS